jgi:hypothetical protein
MSKSSTCQLDSEIVSATDISVMGSVPRRSFLRGAGLAAAGLTCTDFLSHFLNCGLPNDARAGELAAGADKAADNPRFLIYWFIEGGWAGYDMFNPVVTGNNVVERLDNISEERYRVLKWGEENYGIKVHGNIRHGFLATAGQDLFKDMAVLSSMQTSGTGHSSERLRAHLGTYKFRNTDERQEDERSVMQAFAEVCGQPYLLPNLSWHWWLSDGELNEVQYTGRRGYYHALGPRHAHTIYAGTPARLKKFLLRTQEHSGSEIGRTVESFLDKAHNEFLNDKNIHAVKSYHAARSIYLELQQQGFRLDRATLLKLFTDPALREEFKVKPKDELITYRSVNGNKARSKFAPNTNVQAMMTYELMRAGLSCGFFIESRDVRRFDSHYSRNRLWDKDLKPIGMPDQTQMMKEDLWDPLHAFVARLKNTEYRDTGSSFYDHTNIVLTSEFGRSLHGNVDAILKKEIDELMKESEIGGQDICAHWKVSSCAFLGSKVKGDSQFGAVGEKTLMPIPLLPDGSLDPNYDPVTGELKKDRKKHPKSSIPNHGDVYSTALYLNDINPNGRGRNERGPLTFVKRSG